MESSLNNYPISINWIILLFIYTVLNSGCLEVKLIKKEVKLKKNIEQAIKFVQDDKMSIRKVAEHFNLKKSTLIYLLKQYKALGKTNFSYCLIKPRKIFTDDEDLSLVQYLKKAANMHYGLTLQQIKVLLL